MITYCQWPPLEKGGQYVGTGSSGVKGVHVSGVEAICTLHRSQFKNRKVVQEMIEWALASVGS